ncbi:MAG: hypothetical protein WC404_00200 [Candidatus Omnitrophota bacterium]
MNREDISILTIDCVVEFPVYKYCEACGGEVEDKTAEKIKAVQYKLVLKDGRDMSFTRDYNEPCGVFYEWICNTVLPGIKEKVKEKIEENKIAEIKALEVKFNLDPEKENIVEQGDTIVCLESPKDALGEDVVDGPVAGKEYQVLKVIMRGDAVAGYEIVDYNSAVPIRMSIDVKASKLVKKHIPGPMPERVFEIIRKCKKCGEDNALVLKDGKYTGICFKCKTPAEIIQEDIQA